MILEQRFRVLDPRYPELSPEVLAEMERAVKELEAEA
jgi:hypothetical protein